jgi:hypothetical protein
MNIAIACLNITRPWLCLLCHLNMFFASANKLEMFIKKFGASLVFKISSKFAFKNKLENEFLN